MRKVLRACAVINFMTLAASHASYKALFSAILEDDNGLLALLFAFLYGSASLVCCWWLWTKVQRAYLDTHGCRLKDACPVQGKWLALYAMIGCLVVGLYVASFFAPSCGQLFYWTGMVALALNALSLLCLAGYTVAVRLGNRLGKVHYVVPYERCETTCEFNAISGTVTFKTEWIIPEE